MSIPTDDWRDRIQGTSNHRYLRGYSKKAEQAEDELKKLIRESDNSNHEAISKASLILAAEYKEMKDHHGLPISPGVARQMVDELITHAREEPENSAQEKSAPAISPRGA